MRNIEKLVLAFSLSLSLLLMVGRGVNAGGKPATLDQSFMMDEVQDGKKIDDGFELWNVVGRFDKANRLSECRIKVVSLLWSENQTHAFVWVHGSQKITDVMPDTYKVEMNGRLNPFSGLDIVIEFNPDRTKIINISGSMRAGTKGQSISVFQINRNSRNRKVPPVYNPSWDPAREGKE